MERPTREPKLLCVGSYHDDLATEVAFEMRRPPPVSLDSDHSVPGVEKGRRDGAPPGPNVEDERPWWEVSVSDELSSVTQ